MKILLVLALGAGIALILTLMFRGPRRKEPGAEKSGWLAGLGDTGGYDSTHHHSHHSDAGDQGKFDAGGGGGGSHH